MKKFITDNIAMIVLVVAVIAGYTFYKVNFKNDEPADTTAPEA